MAGFKDSVRADEFQQPHTFKDWLLPHGDDNEGKSYAGLSQVLEEFKKGVSGGKIHLCNGPGVNHQPLHGRW